MFPTKNPFCVRAVFSTADLSARAV